MGSVESYSVQSMRTWSQQNWAQETELCLNEGMSQELLERTRMHNKVSYFTSELLRAGMVPHLLFVTQISKAIIIYYVTFVNCMWKHGEENFFCLF